MQGCQHERTEFLHRRDGIDYVRCLDCGQVFEAEDLDSVPVYEEEEDEKPKKRRSNDQASPHEILEHLKGSCLS